MGKLVYIAGPYTAEVPWDRDKNVGQADMLGRRVALAGHVPYIPHKNTWFWDEDERFGKGEEARTFFMRICFAWLEKCDCLLLVPGWENSRGTLEEIEFAKSHGIAVYHSLEELLAA